MVSSFSQSLPNLYKCTFLSVLGSVVGPGFMAGDLTACQWIIEPALSITEELTPVHKGIASD